MEYLLVAGFLVPLIVTLVGKSLTTVAYRGPAVVSAGTIVGAGSKITVKSTIAVPFNAGSVYRVLVDVEVPGHGTLRAAIPAERLSYFAPNRVRIQTQAIGPRNCFGKLTIALLKWPDENKFESVATPTWFWLYYLALASLAMAAGHMLVAATCFAISSMLRTLDFPPMPPASTKDRCMIALAVLVYGIATVVIFAGWSIVPLVCGIPMALGLGQGLATLARATVTD